MFYNMPLDLMTDIELKITLITDGSSDKVLEYPIKWLIREELSAVPVNIEWADLRRARKTTDLADKIKLVLKLFGYALCSAKT